MFRRGYSDDLGADVLPAGRSQVNNPATFVVDSEAPNLAAEIGLAQRVCLDLGPASGGASPNELFTNMNRALPNLTQDQILSLISAAVVHYCPKVLPRPQRCQTSRQGQGGPITRLRMAAGLVHDLTLYETSRQSFGRRLHRNQQHRLVQ